MGIRIKLILTQSLSMLILMVLVGSFVTYRIHASGQDEIAAMRAEAKEKSDRLEAQFADELKQLDEDAARDLKATSEIEMNRVKDQLTNYVDLVYRSIELKYQAATSKEYIEAQYGPQLVNVVDSASSLIQPYIDAAAKGEMPIEKAQAAAKDALRLMRYADGSGYVWINDAGKPYPRMIMHATVPALENQVLDAAKFNCALGKSQNLFQAFVDVCDVSGSGFVDYLWPKPSADGLTTDQPKLSYVKLVKEWDWIIGTGIYVDDAIANSIGQIKRDVAKMQYGSSGYFWINDTGSPIPTMVMHPTVPALDGKLLDDPKFNCAMGKNQNLFQAAVEVCERNGDGFVDYIWPKPTSNGLTEPKAKVSYVKKFAPLNWIVGTGVYTDDVEKAIAEIHARATARRQQLEASLNQQRADEASAIELLVKEKEAEIADQVATLTWQLIPILAGAMVLAVCVAYCIATSITKPINRIVGSLTEGVSQVTMAADQTSSGSQLVATGASEQASSLEETSASLEQMAAMTRTNAENAKTARQSADRARQAAEEGDRTTVQLNQAMEAINDSASQISKIIKVIEEIAFQTNLLALNAAVEAARAGEHGKGFAVVADEVRNLAQRAGQAAGETTTLIESSVNKAHEGTRVADDVGKVLTSIVGDIVNVSNLLGEIAEATNEQAQGVEQLNGAISQIDKVVQNNAAGAEESAAAAEELSSQGQSLEAMIRDLVSVAYGKGRHPDSNSGSANKPVRMGKNRSKGGGQPTVKPVLQPAAKPVSVGSPAGDTKDPFDAIETADLDEF